MSLKFTNLRLVKSPRGQWVKMHIEHILQIPPGWCAIYDFRLKLILKPMKSLLPTAYFSTTNFVSCTLYDNDADIHCAKFQNDWTTETDIMANGILRYLSLKMSFVHPILLRSCLARHSFVDISGRYQLIGLWEMWQQLQKCNLLTHVSDLHVKSMSISCEIILRCTKQFWW